MATTHWRKGYSVNQLFGEVGVTWSFHQLARLLIGAGVKEENILEEMERNIWFTGSLSRSLPPGEIRHITPSSKRLASQSDEENTADKHIVECTYYNIFGLDGPLVEPFSDMMNDDLYYGQGAMRAFINIFNNRIHALRYLIHAQTNYTLASGEASQSHIGKFLLGLSGHSLPQQHRLSGLNEGDLMPITGHLANCRINYPTVCQLMKTVLNLAVIEMQSLIGRWLGVQQEDHTHLGKRNHQLGKEAVLGKKIWDQQAAFGLVVGPVSHQRLSQLVPGGEDYPRLKQLISWLAEKRCDCLLTIVCQPEPNIEDNATFLGKENRVTSRLGYGAALRSDRPMPKRIRFMLNIV